MALAYLFFHTKSSRTNAKEAMKVYFYHTQDLNYIHREWQAGRFPSHLLYGACELPSEGIDVVMHQHTDPKLPRWRRTLDVAWKILTCKEPFDAVYATKHNGLELIILLRAMGLFRKPVIIWHHQPVPRQKNPLKKLLARFFYSGIDHAFMFSDNIVRESIATGIIAPEKLQQCPWGADLDFYDRLMAANPVVHRGFISTGKERRDMPTLLSAFAECPEQRLLVIAPVDCCGVNYEEMFKVERIPENVEILINRTMWIPELAQKIWHYSCICICCEETNYTVGLTTLVEALAFGIPVIISKNPNQPFDASEMRCGISVPYYDKDGWRDAINAMAHDSDLLKSLGNNARQLAVSTYNIRNCAHIVAQRIIGCVAKA